MAAGAGIVLVGAAAYLCFWPIPARPVAWRVSPPAGYVGAYAPNKRLSGLRLIALGKEHGPEHLAIGPGGKLYAAMTSGSILRMEPHGNKQQAFANTGGRVLGFAFDAEGRMIAADAIRGLLRIAPAQEQGSFDPLPCAVMEAGDNAAALEASLIENAARLDLDEVTR